MDLGFKQRETRQSVSWKQETWSNKLLLSIIMLLPLGFTLLFGTLGEVFRFDIAGIMYGAVFIFFILPNWLGEKWKQSAAAKEKERTRIRPKRPK